MSSSSIIDSLRKNPTVYLLSILMAFSLIGIIMIYSASFFYGEQYWGNPLHFTIRQVFHFAIGLIFLRIATLYSYVNYKKWIPFLMLISFLLLLLVLIPGIGTKVGNARRWIHFMGVGFQPSELLKFTLVLWVSGFLDRKKSVLGYFSKGIFPTIVVMGVYFFLLLLQPDFGTAILISLTLFLMIFAAGARPIHMIGSLIGLIGVSTILIFTRAYRLRRIRSFLDPWADPLDAGYQLIQSFIAFGTGGIFGKGLGNSQQKLFFLPEGHTDFIFSILAEETGFVGVMIVLTLIVLLMRKGFEISRFCNDEFGQNLSFGITLLITLQSILHIGVVIGLLPTKGIPLPFISYGGSSLILNMFLIGVLINIANNGTSR